jgi:opacity protein-like surface antigen
MKRPLAASLFALALAACATAPTVYGPATGPSSVGFSEQRIETGRYRVTFRGGPGAPAAQVADYALLRAAELAIADGYDWFRVVDRYTAQSGEGGGPRVSIGAGGGGYRSGVGVGLGTSFNLGGGPAIVQSIEVLMGKGRPAPAGTEVYDAREVRRAVGARI